MIPKHLLELGEKVTHELLEYVVEHPNEWEAKYESDMRVASFVYIGEGRQDNYAGFRLSRNFIDDCAFKDSLWWMINRDE